MLSPWSELFENETYVTGIICYTFIVSNVIYYVNLHMQVSVKQCFCNLSTVRSLWSQQWSKELTLARQPILQSSS